MADHKLLGEILVEQGLVTRKQLAFALIESRRLGWSVGQVLLEHGYITAEQLERALSLQEEEDLSILPGYSLALYAARSGEREEFLRFLRYVRPAGIVGLVDTIDLLAEADPSLIATFSEWDSPRACRAYLNSPELKSLEEELAPLLDAPVEYHQFRSIGDLRRFSQPTKFYLLVVSKVRRMAQPEADARTEWLENALSGHPGLIAMRSGAVMDDSMLAVDLFEWASVEAYQAHRASAGDKAPEVAPQPWRDGAPFLFHYTVE